MQNGRRASPRWSYTLEAVEVSFPLITVMIPLSLSLPWDSHIVEFLSGIALL